MDRATVDTLLRLSQLALSDTERNRLTEDLDKIMAMIDQLLTVATDDVEPLAHPLELAQPLRPDEVTEAVDRELYQSVAPSTEDGLYLVHVETSGEKAVQIVSVVR